MININKIVREVLTEAKKKLTPLQIAKHKYYLANKEKYKDNGRKWIKANPDKIKLASLKSYYNKESTSKGGCGMRKYERDSVPDRLKTSVDNASEVIDASSPDARLMRLDKEMVIKDMFKKYGISDLEAFLINKRIMNKYPIPFTTLAKMLNLNYDVVAKRTERAIQKLQQRITPKDAEYIKFMLRESRKNGNIIDEGNKKNKKNTKIKDAVSFKTLNAVGNMPSDINHPTTNIQNEQLRELLIQAMDRILSPQKAYIVKRWVFDDKPDTEIANEMGLKPSRVKEMYRTALIRLKNCISPKEEKYLFSLLSREDDLLREHTTINEATNPYKDKYDLCKAEASKYKSRGEFRKENHSAFVASQNGGWLDEFFPFSRYSYDFCKAKASKYDDVWEFKKGDRQTFERSVYNGWINEFFPM